MRIPWLESEIVYKDLDQERLTWKTLQRIAEDNPALKEAMRLTQTGMSREQALMVAVVRLAEANDALTEQALSAGPSVTSLAAPSIVTGMIFPAPANLHD